MIDETTVRSIAAELDMPLDIVRQTLAEAEAKPGVNDPVALGKAWLRSQRNRAQTAPRAAAPQPKPFVGYDAQGSCFRSESPVRNDQTDFAQWIVREMREQLLTPADVVRIVRARDAAIWDAIGLDSLKRWANHDHFAQDQDGRIVRVDRDCDLSCWASLPACSGLAECIRSFGGWYPWANDRDAWAAMCARDASRKQAA